MSVCVLCGVLTDELVNRLGVSDISLLLVEFRSASSELFVWLPGIK